MNVLMLVSILVKKPKPRRVHTLFSRVYAPLKISSSFIRDRAFPEINAYNRHYMRGRYSPANTWKAKQFEATMDGAIFGWLKFI